ncbi:MAG TPA: FecR family protein [Flavitalea sp.]|nr:FecR family protein [Flavitalea sp.]
MDKKRLLYLLDRLAAGRLSFSEKDELRTFVSSEYNRERFIEAAMELGIGETAITDFDEKKWEPLIRAAVEVDKSSAVGKNNGSQPPVHRTQLLRTAWLRYAAAIILLVAGAGLYFWFDRSAETQVSQSPEPIQAPIPDLPPGGDRAILTLSDGSSIVLDAAANGTLAKQGGTEIRKRADGQIEYQKAVKEVVPAAVAYNTMRTPRGGQYQIVLPDGTKVWLNAASSITYPTVFAGKDRRVSITGEAYFEVAKNAEAPFHVTTGEVDIKVLGTHFNVNAYDDEELSRTTLLEGGIQLMRSGESSIIKPGQQAQWKVRNSGVIRIADDVDIDQVMAWKRGLFEFSNINLEAIMRQVSRWYDVDVVMEKKYMEKKFGGGISRNLPIRNLLEMLEAYGVKFTLEGKLLKII